MAVRALRGRHPGGTFAEFQIQGTKTIPRKLARLGWPRTWGGRSGSTLRVLVGPRREIKQQCAWWRFCNHRKVSQLCRMLTPKNSDGYDSRYSHVAEALLS